MAPGAEMALRQSTSSGGIARDFFAGWTWRMAWRDSRASRSKLALFSCSIVLGVAALAAVVLWAVTSWLLLVVHEGLH